MAIGALTEEVAANLEEAAEVTRKINTQAVGTLFLGTGIGFAIGFYFGYRFNKEKIRAEAFKESQEDLEKMRKVYQQRATTSAFSPEKPSVEELVEEKGYSTAVEAEERPLRPPVPGIREPETRDHLNTRMAVRTADGEKDKEDGWVYAQELVKRSPDYPYIIHQDEYSLNESEYQQAQITYYAGDDVLTDDDDTIIENRDNLIGENSLKQFGHGTDDFNIVYVRNSQLELEFEICRSPKSYEEEVLGLENDDDQN